MRLFKSLYKARVAIRVVAEYLIPAAATVIASGYARQLGDGLARIRARASKKLDNASTANNPSGTRVELLLEQEDGSYQLAAKGVVDSGTVGEIIGEINDNQGDANSPEAQS
jgi:hypothetical protein